VKIWQSCRIYVFPLYLWHAYDSLRGVQRFLKYFTVRGQLKKTVISGNTHIPFGIPEQPQHSS
jgi:hypothetical protein